MVQDLKMFSTLGKQGNVMASFDALYFRTGAPSISPEMWGVLDLEKNSKSCECCVSQGLYSFEISCSIEIWLVDSLGQ